MGSEERVGLADAIANVRAELTEARDAGQDAELKFRLGDVELEFQVEITKEGGGELGVKFWVINAGANVGVTQGKTNTVKVTLVPQVKDANGNYQDAHISGTVAARPPLRQKDNE